MFSVVYGLYPGNLTVPISSAYAALGHTAWAIGVSFIVIQCCTGYARMIDSLLSLRLIYPLSRLTYCAYLVHPVIMVLTVNKMDGSLHLHNNIVVSLWSILRRASKCQILIKTSANWNVHFGSKRFFTSLPSNRFIIESIQWIYNLKVRVNSNLQWFNWQLK